MVDSPSKVIVQRIATTWTKRTRGARGRERRARLPLAYPLPDRVLVSQSVCALHEVARAEASAYSERFALWFDSQPKSRVGSASAVQLTYRGAGLEVVFDGAAADTGKPRRTRMPAQLLRSRQFATVRFNGRFIGHEDDWYEDKILHIAFEMMPSRGLFLSASSAFVIDARVDLW